MWLAKEQQEDGAQGLTPLLRRSKHAGEKAAFSPVGPAVTHDPATADQVPSLWQVAEGEPLNPGEQVALHVSPTAAVSHLVPLGQELSVAAGGSVLSGQSTAIVRKLEEQSAQPCR